MKWYIITLCVYNVVENGILEGRGGGLLMQGAAYDLCIGIAGLLTGWDSLHHKLERQD